MQVLWQREVAENFPQLAICTGIIRNVKVTGVNEKVEELRNKIFEEVRNEYVLETLKNNKVVRAYRDFYWKLNIDPTKIRPSGEALLRRVLQGKGIPKISNVVDAYNLASLKNIIPLSGFDLDLITPPLEIRFSNSNELFKGIGMNEPKKLERKMLVLADKKQILCIYPYRDADETKITEKTRNVLIVGYGVPGISSDLLKDTVATALNFIRNVAGGESAEVEYFACV